jgi:lipoate-protein ligase A
VGAVPGRSLLRLPPPPSPFDVEQFRTEPGRTVVPRAVSRPTLVLGSTQPAELVGRRAMRERDVELARRRGGGGAVSLGPGEQLWMDAWIPRDDPLWVRDVSVAAEWVGAWWIDALALAGQHGFAVHTGRSVPGELGDLVCFAGRGPGEVFHESAKVVGLSQWRAREGALFSSCAYLRWDPAPLLALLHVDEDERDELARRLAPMAVGLAELDPPVADLERVRELLLGSFPRFGVRPASDGGAPGSV